MTPTHDLTDSGHTAVLGLRVAGIVTSLPVIISLAWAASERRSVHTDVDVGSAFDCMVIGASVYAFLYSTTALIVRLRMSRPIHPGMYIGFDIVAFILLFIMTIMFWIFLQPYDQSAYTSKNLAAVECFGGVMALINCAVHLSSLSWATWASYRIQQDKKNEKAPGKDVASLQSEEC